MPDKFFVSFNSPQCGWMSIGFEGGGHEFHTTTASAPHAMALPELLTILAALLDPNSVQTEFLLKWNRDPEEFDFEFRRMDETLNLKIFQYPTEERDTKERELVFEYAGDTREICVAFYQTFAHMEKEILVDEFETNWHQPFPEKEFRNFESKLGTIRI